MTVPPSADLRRQELLRARLAKARARADRSGTQAITRRPDDAPVRLSYAQRRLWFLTQYEPDSPAYNIPLAVRLRGELDVEALRAALAHVIERHEVLRTLYPTVAGEPAPLVEPASSFVPPAAEPVADEDLTWWLAEQARRPFDLATELPVRAALARVDVDDHLLSLVLHHVAADGWSIGVLADDLTAAYGALRAGGTPRLPALELQYADVAHWQASREGDTRSLDWWTAALRGAPATVTVPTDRPRPAVAGDRGRRITVSFGAERSSRVRSLASEVGATPFVVLLAALQTVLSRYTGSEDVVVGSPIAGRTHSELERLVGCFVNTLALRADLSGEPTVREFLARVRDTTFGAFSHQDVPFERIVDALDLPRDLSHTPLFQVMLNVHNQPQPSFALAGVDATFSDTSTHTAKFDVSVAVVDPGAGSGMEADLVWRTDLYDEATIRRLHGHLTTVLDGMAADPSGPLASLPLLTASELRWLDGSGVVDDTGSPVVTGTLHGLVERQTALTPSGVAVVGADEVLTYAELDARANAVAARLVDIGVGPDTPVGLLADRGAALIVGMLGILKAGGAYLPLDPVYPDGRIRDLLTAADVAAVVVTPALAPRLAAPAAPAAPVARAAAPVVVLSAAVGPPVERTVPSDALCYVLFTSGSTGKPKAVAVEHRNYLNYLHGLRDRTGAEPGWSWALVSTFAADLGTTNVFAALTGGGTLHLLSHDVATDVDAFAEYFRGNEIDAVKLVPSHLEALARSSSFADTLPRRLLICAGEPLRWDLVATVRAAAPDLVLHNHYGPTETTVSMLGTPVPATPLPTPTVPLGLPFLRVRVHVLDARRRPVPVGVPGELYVAGAGVARGYLGRADLTAERFVVVAGERVYRTGDVVRRHTSGALEFLGRADNQVKVRGFRVEIGEVEANLVALPEVHSAVVVARGDGPARKLVAYLVAPGASVSAIRATLRGELPDYMVPGAFVLLDALPLTPNGKVDRLALPDPSSAPAVESSGRAPSSSEELRVAAVFAELLEQPVTTVEDDFFALGGDSFTAVRAVRLIDPALSVIELFQRPTVGELAALLASRAAGTATDDTGLLHRLTRRATPAQLTVVCVPYGGGSPITFQPLADALPHHVALHAIGLPGHDTSRPDEPLMPLDEVAARVVDEIMATIDGPVLLYGHCLGGALATAIGARLEAAGGALRGVALGGTFPAARLPGRFFALLNRLLPADRMLSNRAYLDFLRAMGGNTCAYSEAERSLLVRALRHDVRQAEHFYTEAYAPSASVRMAAPILCVVGEKDRATELYQERYTEWSHFSSTGDVRLAVIPRAGHYFLKHQADQLATILATWATTPTTPPPTPTTPPPHAAPPHASALSPEQLPDRRHASVSSPQRAPDRRHASVSPLERVPERRYASVSAGVDGAEPPRVVVGVGEGPRPSLRTFALVAFGQFMSMIGTGLSAFALGVWVFQRTGSATDFALISMMAVLPAILLSPVAGAVADRFDRRRVMIVADTAAAVGTVGLAALLWGGDLQLWHIYLFSSLGSLCNAFQRPAYLAAIAQLVPKRYLGQANGIAQAGAATGDLLAALAGGVLVGLVGLHGVVLIDMATFLVGVTVLLFVRFPNLLFIRREEPLLREVVTGWRYIVRRRSLVAMVVFFVVFNYLLAVATVLVTPLVLARHSAAVLGVVSAVGGIGGVVGVLVMALWGGTARRAVGMVGFTSVVGVSTVVMGLGAHPAFAAVGLFGLWAALIILNSHWMALIQSKVGMELQGRVLATNQMLAMSMMPLGFLTAGPLADAVFEPLLRSSSGGGLGGPGSGGSGSGGSDGPLASTVGVLLGTGDGRGIGLLLVCTGAFLLVWGLLGLAYRPLRLMEDILPDALPDAEIADKDTIQARADAMA